MAAPRRTRPHRVATDVSDEQFAWMNAQRLRDRVSSADRLRALIELCREDASLRERVVDKATEMAASREGGNQVP